MSQPTSNEPLGTPEATLQPTAAPKKKRGVDVYTVMLVVSAVSLALGCLLMWLELRRYS